jgi:hypothetical protein
MAVEGVAEGHPVDPVHPVCGGRRGQDGRMDRIGWEKAMGAEGHPVDPVHPVGGERRGQDGRMDRIGWEKAMGDGGGGG